MRMPNGDWSMGQRLTKLWRVAPTLPIVLTEGERELLNALASYDLDRFNDLITYVCAMQGTHAYTRFLDVDNTLHS